MSFCGECCVLSGRRLRDGLITRPEESYRVCVCVCMCACGSNPLQLPEKVEEVRIRNEDRYQTNFKDVH